MYNEKQTKNIITKESIANDLCAENKKGIVPLVCFALTYLMVLGIVFSIVYFLGLKGHNIGTVGHIIFFICMFICCLPLFFIISLIGGFGRGNQDIFVVTDEVVYKEEITYGRCGAILIKKVVHFSKFGDIEVNPTWYQLASENDVYYMIVREKDSKCALKCYPAKLYEYKE